MNFLIIINKVLFIFQLLNDESVISDIIEHSPSLAEDCTTISILHEVELLAALGANLQTMRRGSDAHPHLPSALRHLLRLVCTRCHAPAAEGSKYTLKHYYF